jgi:uncharacterized protein YqeY
MLKEQITQELKSAMKNRDSDKMRVLRMIKSSIKKFEVDSMQEASDEDILKIIAKEVKKVREAIEEYKDARPELAKDEEKELKILLSYLPKELTEDEVRSEIVKIVKELNATGPKDFGIVMKTAISRLQGKADGKIINKLVHQVLEA